MHTEVPRNVEHVPRNVGECSNLMEIGRKMLKMHRDNKYIPRDIIEKILLALPGKKVISLLVVNKEWYNIIREIKRPFLDKKMLLVGGFISSDEYIFYYPSFPLTFDFTPASLRNFEVINCGGGILVLSNGNGEIKVSNPFINRTWQLPKVPIKMESNNNLQLVPKTMDSGNFVYGVGFDVKNCIHKILQFHSMEMSGVNMYNMNTSRWSRLEFQCPVIRKKTQVDMGDTSFWLGHDMMNNMFLVCFNAMKETFETYKIVVPHIDAWATTDKYLLPYKDTLLFIDEVVRGVDDAKMKYKVWRFVMNEGNRLDFVFEMENVEKLVPLGLLKEDQLLIVRTVETRSIVCFDMDNGECRGRWSSFGASRVFSYPNAIKSLALLEKSIPPLEITPDE